MTLPIRGEYRVTQQGGGHHGTDYAVPIGTEAVATVDGVVERVATIRDSQGRIVSYGKLVVIRDAQGNRHYYAHLSGFAVQAGQRVSAGAVIGYTGNTGNSTGPHLHYEVRGPGGEQVGTTDASTPASFSYASPGQRRSVSSALGRSVFDEVYDIADAAIERKFTEARLMLNTTLGVIPEAMSEAVEMKELI